MSDETKKISAILNSLPEWERWNNYKDNFDTEKITKSFLENVLLAEPEEKILDFGSGFAMNEYFAKKVGIKIDSLDINTEEVRNTFKKVHEKLGLKTYLYDGKVIPFEDNTYDKIIFKASLTKMVSETGEKGGANIMEVFSELLRISKPEATWYVSPPYMLPRFVTSIVEESGKSWSNKKSVLKLLDLLVEKRPVIVMNDWVKRSTFAFGSIAAMGSKIGWLPENTFDFDAMRRNYKHGYGKAKTFTAGCYCMLRLFYNAFNSFAGNIEIKTIEAVNIGNKDLEFIGQNFRENVDYLNNNTSKVAIKHYAKVSSSYSGKTYIMARGKSAGLIEKSKKELKAQNNDTVIYVNDWKKLLTRYEYSNFSEESINIHFLNRDVALNKLEDRQYFDKTFSIIQSNAEASERDVERKISDFCYGLQQPYAFIPTDTIKTKVKTAGLHAVFYAVKVLKRKDIEILGLDFFEANYLTEHVVSRKPEPQDYQPAKGKIAKEQFLNLVEANPDVNFKIHTYADFSEAKYNNLEVNQLKE